MQEGTRLWHFKIVAPDHPDGIVSFNFALTERITELIHEQDEHVWSIFLGQIVDVAEEKKLKR